MAFKLFPNNKNHQAVKKANEIKALALEKQLEYYAQRNADLGYEPYLDLEDYAQGVYPTPEYGLNIMLGSAKPKRAMV
jgi:hypothetical protein